MRTLRFPTFIVAAALVCALLDSCSARKNSPLQEERVPEATGSAGSATSSQPEDSRPVIVAFGDSLTAGVTTPNYPEQLQELLDSSGLRFRVDNQGVSGDTTTDGLARIGNVMAAHPSLVILEFGGNDGLRGIPIEATRSNLEQMIEHIQAARTALVLLGITLPPNYGPEYVKPFTALFPALARKYHIPYIPFLLANVYQHRELMQPDGIHPNGAGNRIVAQDVFQLIRPLLQSLPAHRAGQP